MGNVVSTFVYATGVNVPDFMVRGGVTYRILRDQLGSVRLVVDVATGTVAQRMEHDEWGRVLVDSAPGFQPFGYAGGLWDLDTGLVHFGAREYDPETGRWTSKDPIGFGGGDANLYGYVLGDPVNGFDPVGLGEAEAQALACEQLAQADGDPDEAVRRADQQRLRDPDSQDLADASHYLFAYSSVRRYGQGFDVGWNGPVGVRGIGAVDPLANDSSWRYPAAGLWHIRNIGYELAKISPLYAPLIFLAAPNTSWATGAQALLGHRGINDALWHPGGRQLPSRCARYCGGT
ncbi:MAG: RHS repeat-associated core domain-containing protein [Deltaproteobacteria bacterium]|nr:RHS repeat-associated core domain-containing protein [Deltaproteobacteria bacterium]